LTRGFEPGSICGARFGTLLPTPLRGEQGAQFFLGKCVDVLAGATDLYGARHGLHGAVELAEVYERLAGFLDEIRGEIEKQAEERLARWEIPLKGNTMRPCRNHSSLVTDELLGGRGSALLPKKPPKSPKAARDCASTTGPRPWPFWFVLRDAFPRDGLRIGHELL
jgi:hypothetical protein